MEHRPFPPSPRRRAAAREAGLHPASPLLVGAAAAAALLIALGLAGAAIAHQLAAAVAAACASGAGPSMPTAAGLPMPTAAGLTEAILAIALPLLGAAAAAAVLAQLVQTGTAWLPRRRVPGAPSPPAGPLPRTQRAAGELAGATAIAVAALAWLWWAAPRLAALTATPAGPADAIVALAPAATDETTGHPAQPTAGPSAASTSLDAADRAGAISSSLAPANRASTTSASEAAGRAAATPASVDDIDHTKMSPLLTGAVGLLFSLVATLIAAWALVAALDAIARRLALTRALAMTAAEKREDDRLAGADPRWRARRAELARGPSASAAVAGATVVLLGDDAAVAIAWDPARRPIPLRTAAGRGPRATQLVGLARRYRIAIHRDPALAAALAAGDGPVPEPEWPRLAAIIAAARGRDRTRELP